MRLARSLLACLRLGTPLLLALAAGHVAAQKVALTVYTALETDQLKAYQ